jgi:O-antigen ligase
MIGFFNETIDESLPYAWITAAILTTYLPRVKGNYHFLLWMLALGCGLGILGNWGTGLGIPMEGTVYEHLNRGGTRMGSGRGDVNDASVAVGFALWTAVALLLPVVWNRRGSRRLWLGALTLLTIFLCGIPLISMGSRGGLIYLVLGGAAVLMYALNIRALAVNALKYTLFGVYGLLLLLPVLGPALWDTKPGRMLQATLEYNETQAAEAGGNSLAAGRADIWSHVLKIVMDYPLFGVPKGAVVDMGEFGLFIVGGPVAEGAGKGAATHNMLLDLAASRGIPAMIVFVIAFFRPVIDVMKRMGSLYAFPFIIAHFVTLLCFMNLSILNWKTYWALHVLTAFCAASPHRLRSGQPGDGFVRR